MLTFHNPGELDPRLITTFGVSIKESANPIGHFGTGIKYGIATLLRTGHQIVIYSGLSKMTFRIGSDVIRGKSVPLVYMTIDGEEIQCPFAVDLGKNWEPWMAYRELRANAMDEDGGVATGAMEDPRPDLTMIQVTGKPIEQCHTLQHKYFLTGTPVFTTEKCEVYARSGTEIFYRGVKVGDHKLPGLYTYNILREVKLTEDRTIDPEGGQYSVRDAIEGAWTQCTNERLIEEVLTAKITRTMEGNIEFSRYDLPWDATPELPFIRVVRRLSASKINNLNSHARNAVREFLPKEKFSPTPADLTPVERAMLGRAKSFLARHFSVPLATKIHASDNLGDGVLGMVLEKDIWVSRLAMSQGTKMLAGTIYEEWLHAERNLRDESRSMQNFLLDRLMSLGEAIQGEPL